MALTAAEVQKSYLAYFGRPADPTGLAYWMSNDATTIKSGFAASAEYATLYNGMSTEQRVEQVYQNLLGRASDATGKAYWVAEMNAGRETVSSLVTSIQANALNGDVTTIANRVAYANDFTAALDTAAEIAGYAGTGASNAARSVVSAVHDDAASLTTAKAALTTSVSTVVAASTTSGKLIDGYVKDATVFADANGDRVWNEGEAKATTDASGNFSLHGATGKIIGSGGTDISTNKPFKGVMTAPDGATVLNPLTTMQQAFMDKGYSIADAEAKVGKALGIDVSKIDLTTFDPLGAALDPNVSAADKAFAANMQSEALKVANFLVAGAGALSGAAGGADKLSDTQAMDALMQAMINTIEKDADGVVSMSDTAFLKAIMADSIATSGNADLIAAESKVTAMEDSFATMLADSAGNIDAIIFKGEDITKALAELTQVSSLAQGDMADKIAGAALDGGSLDSLVGGFTGAAADAAAAKTIIGDLDPNSTTDNAAIDAANSEGETATTAGGGGGDSTPAATTDTTPPDATISSATYQEDNKVLYLNGNHFDSVLESGEDNLPTSRSGWTGASWCGTSTAMTAPRPISHFR